MTPVDALRTIPGATLDPGWETRGNQPLAHMLGVVVHHTGGALGHNDPSRVIVRDGRGGANPVPGPLCNIFIPRDGTIHVVAGRKANHGGGGSSVVLADLVRGVAPDGDAKVRHLADTTSANSQLFGIELEHVGTTAEAWGPQISAVIGVLAHLCSAMSWSAAHVIGHREWTARKVDPVYASGLASMNWLRNQVAARLAPSGQPSGQSEPSIVGTTPPTSTVIDESLPILGPPLVTLEQAIRIVNAHRPLGANGYSLASVREILGAYEGTCQLAGVSFAVAVAQLAHETGWITSWWSARPRRNPAGIGVTGATYATEPLAKATRLPYAFNSGTGRWCLGCSFPAWAGLGGSVDAHVGRLAAYAIRSDDGNDLQRRAITIANAVRTIPASVRGKAPTLKGLEGVWAVPGVGYATKLAAIIRLLVGA